MLIKTKELEIAVGEVRAELDGLIKKRRKNDKIVEEARKRK